MRYRELIRKIENELNEAGIGDSVTDARLLVMHRSGMSQAALLLKYDEAVPEDELKDILELTKRRLSREPLQYIFGEQEFMGMDFLCGPECLIPRQDTEILVEKVLEIIKNDKDKTAFNVLDMCTGSGCIALSIAKMAPHVTVTGADISEAALATAAQNAKRLGADVRFISSDLFEKITDVYDIIVSNPPYIVTDEIHGLIPEIYAHEPMIALDGGADGLMFYRRIVKAAPAYLRHGGYIAFEIGEEEALPVKKMLLEQCFTDVMIYKDLADYDRVITAKWP